MSAGRAARCLATNWLQTLTTTTFAAHFCTPASSRNMVSRPCSRQIRPPKPPLTVHRPEIVPSMSWIQLLALDRVRPDIGITVNTGMHRETSHCPASRTTLLRWTPRKGSKGSNPFVSAQKVPWPGAVIFLAGVGVFPCARPMAPEKVPGVRGETDRKHLGGVDPAVGTGRSWINTRDGMGDLRTGLELACHPPRRPTPGEHSWLAGNLNVRLRYLCSVRSARHCTVVATPPRLLFDLDDPLNLTAHGRQVCP